MSGPEIYEYKKICPSCHREWVETRLQPAQKPEKYKLCQECKAGEGVKSEKDKSISDLLQEQVGDSDEDKVEVRDHAGLNQFEKCGNCKHFNPIDDEMEIGQPWGRCGKGYSNPDIEEYTLTWAVDNLDRCPISEEEYEDYGDEDLDLVHWFDTCPDFEEGDND